MDSNRGCFPKAQSFIFRSQQRNTSKPALVWYCPLEAVIVRAEEVGRVMGMVSICRPLRASVRPSEVFDHYLKQCSINSLIWIYLVDLQQWFHFRSCRPNCGSMVAPKGLKLLVFNFHSWCVYLFVTFSEIILFWAMLAQFGTVGGPKATPSPGRLIIKPTSVLVCIFIW